MVRSLFHPVLRATGTLVVFALAACSSRPPGQGSLGPGTPGQMVPILVVGDGGGASERGFQAAAVQPLSLFSVGMGPDAWAVVRGFLEDGVWPPAGSVHVGSLINHFRYDYPAPRHDALCSISADMGPAFRNPAFCLLRVGLRPRDTADFTDRDITVHVEFNPARVAYYRLIGAEESPPRAGEFPDGTVGTAGTDRAVTVLYEILPNPAYRGESIPLPFSTTRDGEAWYADQWAQVTVCRKDSEDVVSRGVWDDDYSPRPSSDFRLAAAVAAFGLALDEAPSTAAATLDQVLDMATDPAVGSGAERREWADLVCRAARLNILRQDAVHRDAMRRKASEAAAGRKPDTGRGLSPPVFPGLGPTGGEGGGW